MRKSILSGNFLAFASMLVVVVALGNIPTAEANTLLCAKADALSIVSVSKVPITLDSSKHAYNKQINVGDLFVSNFVPTQKNKVLHNASYLVHVSSTKNVILIKTSGNYRLLANNFVTKKYEPG